MFCWGLKHEHVTDFSRRDRLLSSRIINEFLKKFTNPGQRPKSLSLPHYFLMVWDTFLAAGKLQHSPPLNL